MFENEKGTINTLYRASSTDVVLQSNNLRFVRGMVAVPTDDGVLVDGFAEPIVLRGTLAVTLLPRLIPCLDGTGSLHRIKEANFPKVPIEFLQECVESLADWGLLETPDQEEAPPLNSEGQFLLRLLSARKSPRSISEVLARIQNQRTEVITSRTYPMWAKWMQASLVSSGLLGATISDGQSESTVADPLSVISLHSLLDRESAQVSVSKGEALRIWLNEELQIVEVGISAETVRRRNRTASVRKLANGSLAALVAVVTRDILLRVGLPELGPGQASQVRYSVDQWQAIPVYGSTQVANSKSPLAKIFEDAIALDGRTGMAQTASERLGLVTMPTYPRVRLTSAPRSLLPALEVRLPATVGEALSPGSPQPRPVGLEDVTVALDLTFGFRPSLIGEAHRRWAPNAGNLGSPGCCLLIRDVADLREGLYEYLPSERALADRSTHEVTNLAAFAQQVLGTSLEASATLLITSAFYKLNSKYGAFGYKLAGLDAGIALSQLQAIFTSLSIPTTIRLAQDDSVIHQQLGLRVPGEWSAAVVAVNAVEKDLMVVDSDRGSGRLFVDTRTAQTFRRREGLTMQQLLETLQLEALHRREPDRTTITDREALVRRSDRLRDCVLPLSTAILARRSSRVFARSDVPAGYLMPLLGAASEEGLTNWLSEPGSDHPLQIVLLNRAADNLYMLYAYDGSSHELTLANSLSRSEVASLYVQEGFENAPVHIWIFGSISNHSSPADTATSYRRLLMRAGGALNRSWLVALSFSLSGCIVAGLIRQAARDLLGVPESHTFPLVAFCAGFSE